MNNAAERLLGLDEKRIRDQAQDIILGQLRLVIATLSIEEINKDREKFMALVNENVAQEINKIGLDLINVNVRANQPQPPKAASRLNSASASRWPRWRPRPSPAKCKRSAIRKSLLPPAQRKLSPRRSKPSRSSASRSPRPKPPP